MTDNVLPRRLVFIQEVDSCMFCDHPKGEVNTHFVDRDQNMGYISCNICVTKAEEAVKNWEESLMYGRANYLKDRDIKVKRTSGEIESGWTITNPLIFYSYTGIEKIQCCNKEQSKEKWCLMDEILELNPRTI